MRQLLDVFFLWLPHVNLAEQLVRWLQRDIHVLRSRNQTARKKIEDRP